MTPEVTTDSDPRWWRVVLFTAMAGGLGWGIRGQYGHETGAMIAGLLVSLTLAVMFSGDAPSLPVARAIAWGTIAIGFGGSMTYGQTIGLTQNAHLMGHWDAFGWGMLGLAIKGGIWIGFAGVFLGMGFGGITYHPRELTLLMLAMILIFIAGVYLLNSPLDPAAKRFPLLYFSEHWRWAAPDVESKPRGECWGGLLPALAMVIAYTGWRRKDGLARNLALWGFLGGALGFPLGQCIQAFHAWNPELFTGGLWRWIGPHMNWWNMMEITFGAIMGGALGLGLWRNRKMISFVSETPPPAARQETLLLIAHTVLLSSSTFGIPPWIGVLYGFGFTLGILPIAGCARGRWWPYVLAMPITLLPIAGKTFRQLVHDEAVISPVVGGFVYLIVPLVFAMAAAVWFIKKARSGQTGRDFARMALLCAAWLYFLLNFAFFGFPWPWTAWTGRTPSNIIFVGCVLGLTTLAWIQRKKPVCSSPKKV